MLGAIEPVSFARIARDILAGKKDLRQSQSLVVSGYGFGDCGVNSQILQWLFSAEPNVMVVIHPEPDTLWSSVRGEVTEQHLAFQETGQLQVIPKVRGRVLERGENED
jgi:hypothetical protein